MFALQSLGGHLQSDGLRPLGQGWINPHAASLADKHALPLQIRVDLDITVDRSEAFPAQETCDLGHLSRAGGLPVGQPRGSFDLALPDLNKVLAAQPADVKALGLRGSAHLVGGDAAKAIEDYSKAIDLNPRDVHLLMARGSAYTQIGEHKKSLADREAAVSLRPRMSETYIARGGSYHELGEHEKGLADRTEAIRLAPDSGLAWAARGNALFLLARYDEALADLRKAAALLPQDQPTKELIEKAEILAGVRARPQVASSGPPLAATMVEAKVSALTATSVLDLPRSVEPPAVTETAVLPADRATSSPPAVSEQAVFTPSPPVPPPSTVVESPRAAVAEPVRAKAVVVAPPTVAAPQPASALSAEQLNQRGRELMAQKEYQQAIGAFTRALAIKPNFTLALNARGFSYYMLKQFAPALADLNQAIKLDPNYVNAYHNRSILFQQSGEPKAADGDRQTEQRLLQLRK